MTVIVGIVEQGTIYMASDSRMTIGYDVATLAPSVPKVFHRGPFLIGITGSVRALQLLHYRLDPPAQQTDDDMEHIAITVVDSIRQLFKDGGVAEQTNGAEFTGDDEHYSRILIGYRGRLYRVAADYNVTELTLPYVAMGSGEDFALGSLYFNATVGGDVRIETLEVA